MQLSNDCPTRSKNQSDLCIDTKCDLAAYLVTSYISVLEMFAWRGNVVHKLEVLLQIPGNSILGYQEQPRKDMWT
jgi:hypothetical protein